MTDRPDVTALLLAAGHSSRMEGANKLLLPLGDMLLLEQSIRAVLASSVARVIVVTGHQDRAIREALHGYSVTIAYNPQHAFGMATSLRRGLIATPGETQGFLICLADMPFIKSSTFDALLDRFGECTAPSILIPIYQQRPGHPVLFHHSFRPELMALEGDVGARSVIEAHPEATLHVDVKDPGILQDIDTHDAYEQASGNPHDE